MVKLGVLWATRDGGSSGYIGLGYSLIYYRKLQGEHGPEIWFWFTPFRMYWTTERHGLSWLFHSRPKEPSYKGRTLSGWVSVWYRGYSGEIFATSAEQRDSETAIRAMGTNCIPPLLAWLSGDDPGLNQLSSVESTFQILGEAASPAAPALVQLTTNKNKELRWYALKCLKAVRPEKNILVPALIALVKDPDKNISYYAAETLVQLDPDAAEKAGVYGIFPQFK